MSFTDAPALPGWLAPLFPAPRRCFQLETGADRGRTIHFVDTAPDRDEAILLLHGNPTWSFLWRKVIERLPERRCVAPDLLGLGLSSRLSRMEDHSIDRHADALAELVEALELRSILLVGQDWGGPMTAALGRRFPDRIRGLVLGNTSVLVPERPRGTAFHRFARTPVASDIVFRGLGFPQSALWFAQGDRRSIRGKVARAYRWALRDRAGKIAPLALARMVPDSPGHPSVQPLREGEAWARGFEGPVGLVWGERDPILGRALGRHERAFPGAPVIRTQAGHFLQEEVPGPIAEMIQDVWRRGPTR